MARKNHHSTRSTPICLCWRIRSDEVKIQVDARSAAGCRNRIGAWSKEPVKSGIMRTIMKTVLCEDSDWLMSEEAFSIYASCMYHPTYEDYKAKMEDCLSDPAVKVFVCKVQGRKTGMMVLRLSEASAEIIGIAVSENARRKGIGKQLILNAMQTEDLASVRAQTDDDSIGFYRKCGFSEERTVIQYPDGPAVRYNCVLYRQMSLLKVDHE